MALTPVYRTIEATIHGRYVLQLPPGDKPPLGLLVGFHGYAQNAEALLEEMRRIPGADRWLLCSIQALHRFYRSRSAEVVASWMTSEDRELAIEDNIAYVGRALAEVVEEYAEWEVDRRVVLAGFSQGVAMACRAACSGVFPCHGLVMVGGDVPPELRGGDLRECPPALLARGKHDAIYPEEQMREDLRAFEECGVAATPLTFEGRHEWGDPAARAIGDFLDKLTEEETGSEPPPAERREDAPAEVPANEAVAGGRPAGKALVQLSDVVNALDMQSDEVTCYMSRKTGEFLPMWNTMLGRIEDGRPLDSDMPEWERKDATVAADIVENRDAYVSLPDRFDIDEYDMMRRFCADIGNARLRDRMHSAIRGRGAFRVFKDTAHRHGLIGAWYEFRERAYLEVAAEWCVENNISYE